MLSEREGALLSLSDSLGDGAAVLDAEGKIKGVNKRFLEMLGVPEQGIVGKRLDLVKTFRGQGVSKKLAEPALRTRGVSVRVWIHGRNRARS